VCSSDLQRQRVAMGRAIVRDPQVFLFDEPLSNLDAKLRVQMRLEIRKLQKRLGVTSIYVTHDQAEALTMADRIAVFNDGVIQQLSSPDELYEKPANSFVAQFIGENNRLNGTVLKIEGNTCTVELDGGGTVSAEKVNVGGVGARATLSIRPERIELAPEKGSMSNTLPAKIEELIYLGDHIRVRMSVAKTDEFVVKVRNAASRRTLKVGEKMNVGWRSQDCRALDLNGA